MKCLAFVHADDQLCPWIVPEQAGAHTRRRSDTGVWLGGCRIIPRDSWTQRATICWSVRDTFLWWSRSIKNGFHPLLDDNTLLAKLSHMEHSAIQRDPVTRQDLVRILAGSTTCNRKFSCSCRNAKLKVCSRHHRRQAHVHLDSDPITALDRMVKNRHGKKAATVVAGVSKTSRSYDSKNQLPMTS